MRIHQNLELINSDIVSTTIRNDGYISAPAGITLAGGGAAEVSVSNGNISTNSGDLTLSPDTDVLNLSGQKGVSINGNSGVIATTLLGVTVNAANESFTVGGTNPVITNATDGSVKSLAGDLTLAGSTSTINAGSLVINDSGNAKLTIDGQSMTYDSYVASDIIKVNVSHLNCIYDPSENVSIGAPFFQWSSASAAIFLPLVLPAYARLTKVSLYIDPNSNSVVFNLKRKDYNGSPSTLVSTNSSSATPTNVDMIIDEDISSNFQV